MFEEIMINQFLQLFTNPVLNIAFQLLSLFGHPITWFTLAAWLFWAGYEKKSITLMSILLMASIVTSAVKYLVARPRPSGLIALDDLKGYSMPSGHMVIATALAGYVYYSKWIKKNVKWVVLLLTLIAGISRIYLGVHYFSDVLVGILLGWGVGLIIIKLEAKIISSNFHISSIKEEILLIVFFLVLILANLIIPEEYYGAYAILGYFTGYAIYKHTNLDKHLSLTKSKKQLLTAFFIGTAMFGVIGVNAYYLTTGTISKILFFIGGIFVTLLWPLMISFSVKKREVYKINKKIRKKNKKTNL